MQKIFFNLKKYHNKVAFIDNDLKNIITLSSLILSKSLKVVFTGEV